MMITAVVQAFYDGYWERYGRALRRSAVENWPQEWLHVVVSDKRISGFQHNPLLTTNADYQEFQTAYSRLPHACGFAANGDYSWRKDAVKWAPQLIAPSMALPYLEDGDLLVWLDGDVETLRPVPADFFEGLIGDDDVVHLGRNGTHSEIGFWAIRMSPEAEKFLRSLAHLYKSGEIFGLREWHSAYGWDHCLRLAPALKSRSLSEGTGHVWFRTPLGQYFDHMKGKRKDRGRSAERR